MCMTYKCFKCWLFLILIKNRYCKTNQSFCNILIYDCSHDILFTFSDLWVGNFVLKVHSSSITCLFYFYGIRDTFRDAFKPDFWKKKTWDGSNFQKHYRCAVLNWVVQISCGQSRVLLRDRFGMLKGNRLGNLVFDRLPLKEYKRFETWPLCFLLLPPLQFCMGARFRGRDLRETQGKYKYPYH